MNEPAFWRAYLIFGSFAAYLFKGNDKGKNFIENGHFILWELYIEDAIIYSLSIHPVAHTGNKNYKEEKR